MALAGITGVGEFHYLHHGPGGARYADPNAMGHALIQAAADAGIRLTLLDTCYLAGGLGPDGHLELGPEQVRFGDGDADGWAERAGRLADTGTVRIGAAVHSVRAVPRAALPVVAAAAQGRPLHVHLSEQPAENEAALAHYGRTPTQLLAEQGVLGPLTSAVHATHLTDQDIATLGRTGTTSCFCPTTERDLADGIGPAMALRTAGSPLSLGSDQHAVIDLIEEARALEMHERLASLRRGRFTPAQLLAAATRHDSLGWADAGALIVGAWADLVAVRLDSPRTAGADPAQVLLAATAADVATVVVDGRTVVADGRHRLGDVGDLGASTRPSGRCGRRPDPPARSSPAARPTTARATPMLRGGRSSRQTCRQRAGHAYTGEPSSCSSISLGSPRSSAAQRYSGSTRGVINP